MCLADAVDFSVLVVLLGNLLSFLTVLDTMVFLANVGPLVLFDTDIDSYEEEFWVSGILEGTHSRTDCSMELTVHLEHKLPDEETMCKILASCDSELMQISLSLVSLVSEIFCEQSDLLTSTLCV